MHIKLFLSFVKPKDTCHWACHECMQERSNSSMYSCLFHQIQVSGQSYAPVLPLGNQLPLFVAQVTGMVPRTSLFALIHGRTSCLSWDPKHNISVFHPVDQSLYRLCYSCFFLTVDTSIGDKMTNVFFVCIYLILLQQGFVFIIIFVYFICSLH